MPRLFIGTAAWTIPRDSVKDFPGEGTHLERYARVLSAVEINSSFYKPHRRATYERWAASTPDGFRFSVKMPKAITHEAALDAPEAALDAFLEQCGGLGAKLGVILVQLPPKLAFDRVTVRYFFEALRERYSGQVAMEPRNATFFTAIAEAMFVDYKIARVAADPPRDPRDGVPGGYGGFTYARYHGTPRVYYSPYDEEQCEQIAAQLVTPGQAEERWCMFDNTGRGYATADALAVQADTLRSA